MSNIKVVKIDKIIEKNKTKKNRSNPELEYLKNIIRNKEKPNKKLSDILTKNKEIEQLLSKKTPKKSLKKTFTKINSQFDNNKLKLPDIEPQNNKISLPQSSKLELKINKPKPAKKNNKLESKTDKIKPAPNKIKSKPNKSNQKNINLINNKLKELKSKKKKKTLPKNILNLKPTTKKDLDKFFKKFDNKKSKKKKIISANKKAPILKRKSKQSKSLKKKSNITNKLNNKKNIITNNPYTKIVKKIIKKNSSKINNKEINELSREKLISKLFNLDLINKDTTAPTSILQDIYKIYKITHKSITIKK